MKILLFFLILVLSVSCTSENKEDTNAGKLNQVCKSDKTCNDDLACVDDKCTSKDDACKYITCSGEDGLSHGVCTIESSKTVCICNDDYDRVDDIKCKISGNQDICKAATCKTEDGYVCIIEDKVAKCVCPANYKETEGHDMCILNQDAFCKPNPCDKNKNMTGFCSAEMTDNGVVEKCECERGWVGETCEEKEGGCDKTLCLNDENSTGECYIDVSDPNKETICICKEGFILDEVSTNNWKCIAEEGE